MKKVDFSALRVEYPIGVFTLMDSRVDLGNLIYKNANTIELDNLSRKIHGAPTGKAIEFTDEEVNSTIAALEYAGLPYYFIAAIKRQADGVEVASEGDGQNESNLQ